MLGINFKVAWNGLQRVITTQKTFKIQLAIALLVALAAFYFNFSQTEWLILILTMSLVLVAEVFNTAIETFADGITRRRNNHIKHLKDISAGAVLLTAIMSVVIGVILFYPKIIILLS